MNALMSRPRGAAIKSHRRAKGESVIAALKDMLPKRMVKATTSKMRMANLKQPQGRGFVLDYTITLVSATNFTFKSDTTYHVSGTVYCNGTNTFEGGTVLKYATNGTVQIVPGSPDVGDPRVVWQGWDYRPVIFTAKDDNSVGETITGSTGSPSGFYGDPMLLLSSLAATPTINGLRMAYGKTALSCVGANANVYGAQILNCQKATYLLGANLLLGNALLTGNNTNFFCSAGGQANVQNATVSAATCLAAAPSGPLNNEIMLTNCVLANVTNLFAGTLSSAGSHNAFYSGSTFGDSPITVASYPFQAIGGGAHYLVADSACRNAGTTNLDATLLADLAAKTTYPPLAYTNTTLPGYDTFYPMAQRDTDAPDLGYHYDPLDYLVGGVDVNVDTTFAPGTAVGWFRYNQGWYHAGHGIHVADTKALTFDGQAESPCYFIHQTAVQENRIGYATVDAGPGGITGWAATITNRPFLNLQFTRCAGLPIYHNYFRDDWGGLYVSANHSEFYGGGLGGYASDLGLTNCLLDRSVVWLSGGNTNYADVFALRNCTVRGGAVSISRESSTTGHTKTAILDPAFDDTTISTSDPHASNASLTRYDYNAYLTNASRTYPTGVNDVLVSSFNWQRGWLGDFYLPAGSSLINTGSVANAASVGLYHFTTVTNQVKETNSTVDIGYHYVALDTNNLAVDTDTGGVADYLEDPNGSGTVNGGETDWTSGHGNDDKDHKVNKHLLTPGYLRCEYRVDPWGVDAKDPWTGQQKPRLYWILTSQRRMAKQVAYRILVASSPENLNSDNGDMWDSGKVCSDQTIHVEYDPAQHQLQSGQRLWWKVKTWELFSGKASPWSTNAFFQMGLLNTNDWDGAKWIRMNTTFTGVAPMYRKAFIQLTNEIKRATANVSAKGAYELWINGQRIGDGLLAPEWTDFRKRIQYQTFDVTTNLISAASDGTNHVVGAIVGKGWFDSVFQAGYPGQFGTPCAQFLLKIIIERKAGTNIFVASDGSWGYFGDGPIRSASIYDGEAYDARKEAPLADWTSPVNTGAAGNFTATVDGAATNVDYLQMVAQPTDPIRIMEYRHPVDMWTNRDGGFYRIYDLGQNIAGWCILSFTNTTTNNFSGTEIYVRHSESLILNVANNMQGGGIGGSNIYTANLGGAAQRETYTLTSNQVHRFQPHFTYHGFRYVQIEAPESLPLDINSITGCVIRSSIPETGNFACSQRDVNQLMTNIAWTLKDNLYGIETDCTQRRERFGWLGDSDAFSQTACFMMDMSSQYTRAIRDIRDEQDQNPASSLFGKYEPNNPFNALAVADIGWCTGGLIKPWQLHQNYADWRILQEHYISASNWVALLDRKFPSHVVTAVSPWGSPNGDWLNCGTIRFTTSGSPTWPTGNATMNGVGVHQTCYFAHGADLMAKMSKVLQAQALSRNDTAAAAVYGANYTTYTTLASNIRSAFQSSSLVTYTSGNITGIGNSAQADFAYALFFDMVLENQRGNCLDLMLNRAHSGIHNYNDLYTYPGESVDIDHLSTGIMGTGKGMLELTRNGLTSLAYQLLTDYRFPSWLYQVTAGGANYTGPAEAYGATTCWERWDGLVSRTPGGYNTDINSLNHFWAGSVGEWIYRNIGGLNPDDENLGYQNVIVQPRLWGGISNAIASFNSIHGAITNSWYWTNSPTTTNFYMKLAVPANITASVYVPSTNPAAITEGGFPATNALGVLSYEVKTNATVFRLGSGTYNFGASGINF